MSEYIIEWSGIGSDVTEMVQSDTPPWKVTKEIRHARLREPIVRCRDCTWFHWDDSGRWCAQSLVRRSDPDGFCAWGEREDS